MLHFLICSEYTAIFVIFSSKKCVLIFFISKNINIMDKSISCSRIWGEKKDISGFSGIDRNHGKGKGA